MAKKTNKTSHVMDLLTNGASPEAHDPASLSPDGSAQGKNGDVQSHTVTPTKVTVVDEGSRNDRISQDILNKLSEELQEEMRQEIASQPNQAPSQANAPSAAPVADPAPSNAAGASQAQQSFGNTPSSLDSIQTVIPESEIDNGLRDSEFRFINVMEQLLLDEDVGSFLDQYNTCKCQQCIADICARTLTRLPAKYVVASKGSLSPILSYYKNRYKILMLTEFMKACEKVSQHPHHGRD